MRSLANIFLLTLAFATPVVGAEENENKNLQVLSKTLTRLEVRKLMKAQNKALGVECEYCHEVQDMASDKKDTKGAARMMMKMTNELNEKYFADKKNPAPRIGCVTCHRGQTDPPKL